MERMFYDNDGRIVLDSIQNTGAVGFPRHPAATLRALTLNYDARGRDTLARDPAAAGDTLVVKYSGLGHLVYSKLVEFGNWLGPNFVGRYASSDSVRYDALGNVTRTRHSDTTYAQQGAPSFSVANSRRSAVHQSGTGRLALDSLFGPEGTRTLSYDSTGNVRFASRSNDGQAVPMEDRASYFSADNRLRAADWRYIQDGTLTPSPAEKRQLVEYRYDALGRRVWELSTASCLTDGSIDPITRMMCQLGKVKRFLWDGDAELVEIQMPLVAVAPSNPLENDTAVTKVNKFLINGVPSRDPNPYFGRVIYTPGLRLDQPVAVTRIGYADWPAFGIADTTYKGDWGPFTLQPFWSARGVAPDGAFSDGARYKYTGTGTCSQLVDTTRCVALPWTLDWSAYSLTLRGIPLHGWHGGTLEDKGDNTGLAFRRNRYYDAETSRFTQEDPIGLGGGLNLYGFANGDPVDFGDPFGLRTCTEKTTTLCDAWDAFKKWASEAGSRIVSGVASLHEVLNPMVDVMASLVGHDPTTGEKISGGDRAVLAASAALGGFFLARPGGRGRLTNAQARDFASWLGFTEVKGARSSGQLVFTNGVTFISPDITSHTGGVWKQLNRNLQRVGTLDALLQYFGK